MKLHPGAFRQVHSMMKKASHRGQAGKRQWGGRSEELGALGPGPEGAMCT